MGSNAYSKSQAARAAAILTNTEVAAGTLDLNGSVKDQRVTLQVAFTLGSLTNVILRLYGSVDGSTWVPCAFADGTTVSKTLTADTTALYSVAPLPGVNFFRATAQGTDTLTSSSLTLTYRWRRAGS